MTQPLAIDGGAPVRSTLLPYARHWVDEADINAATSVLRGDWLTTGPEVNAMRISAAGYAALSRQRTRIARCGAPR